MSLFYYANEATIQESQTPILVEIPSNIKEKRLLFKYYATELNFPEYFGWNWDAFFECMITLPDNEIYIFHNDVPLQNDQEGQNTYIFLLHQIVLEWAASKTKKISIIFPEKSQTLVTEIEAKNSL